MNAPMSDERLAEIRVLATDRAVVARHLTAAMRELLAEIEHLRGEREADDERTEYAVNLVIALADASPCFRTRHGHCGMHNEYIPEGGDCPHALARAFLAGTGAWSTT